MGDTKILDAVSSALAKQSWFLYRKDSITAVAGTILQIANFKNIDSYTDTWVGIAIAIVIGIAQVIVHAGTKGAITPSMAGRLQAALPTKPVFDLDAERENLAIPVQEATPHAD